MLNAIEYLSEPVSTVEPRIASWLILVCMAHYAMLCTVSVVRIFTKGKGR